MFVERMFARKDKKNAARRQHFFCWEDLGYDPVTLYVSMSTHISGIPSPIQ